MHTMLNEYYISLYLDTRREKKTGKYPVKLRVFTPRPRKQKLYATTFAYTENEFKSIWESKKPRKENKEDRIKLEAIQSHANDVASKISLFTFESFERSMKNGSQKYDQDVTFYYKKAISEYKTNKQIGTASSYDLSLKSLKKFHCKDILSFYEITPQWLKEYENFMINSEKRSRTTVGIYLRPLRAIFNTFILIESIDSNIYPFSKKRGDKKYKIPAPKGTKKALSSEQLKLLYKTKPVSPEQKKAKDFWFFSYFCNGMNVKDIAYLRYKDISDDTVSFRRAKTANTNTEQKPIIVYLNKFTKGVIDKYGNPDKMAENNIFNIIDPSTDPEIQHRDLNNFIRYINQHFIKLAQGVNIHDKISTYWARHSYTTNAIRGGASMEFVSESLGHNSLNTTRSYFAGFENGKKREIAKKLLKF